MAIQETDLTLFRSWQKEWDFICNLGLKEILGFDMNADSIKTYLLAQSEMGGFEIVLPLPLLLSEPGFSGLKDSQDLPKPIPKVAAQNDSLWKNAACLNDFYEALRKHSIYAKSMRPLSFLVPKEIKTNASYLLLFHSPQELTAESKDILERLFKRLGIDLNSCAISFFFKCNETAMPREKPVLREMLCKEIELLNPEKIIFFREAQSLEKIEKTAKVDGIPITFAGKPAITLYSLLEMLPSKSDYKEKMLETWNSLLPSSGWFSLL
jgi:hypothetical protein